MHHRFLFAGSSTISAAEQGGDGDDDDDNGLLLGKGKEDDEHEEVLLGVVVAEKHRPKKAFVSPLTMTTKESGGGAQSWIRTLFFVAAFLCFVLFYEETLAVRKTLRAQMTTFGSGGRGASVAEDRSRSRRSAVVPRRDSSSSSLGANISSPISSPPISSASLRRHFVSGEDRDGFFHRFFEKNFQDVEKFGQNEKLSRERMRAAVRRDSRKLALYALRRNTNNPSKSVFEWVRLEGQTQWWSTNGFHEFMRDKVADIGQKYLQDDFKETWFLINCFDEPLMMGECPKQQQLSNLHGLIQRRTSPFSFSGDGVVVWSMAKVDGCHDDLLFPFPDYFRHAKNYITKDADRNKGGVSSILNATERSSWEQFQLRKDPSWDERSNDIKFRGSSTGSRTPETNLRNRVIKDLINEPGFDVGFTDFIQGFPHAHDLAKPRMGDGDFGKNKVLLDIDGNSHSFNRQLVIARAGSAMLRINVFNDWFSRGLEDGEFSFTVNPENVLAEARAFRDDKLLGGKEGELEDVRQSAMALQDLAQWLDESVGVRYMGQMIKRYVNAMTLVD
ncbi:unnamed protein product [Bathycoccus prasinos]|uniref:Unnamed protein product n=1 Tax=Bathycoccus prasinos TaxID=41875 RepID=K8ERC9_9CHLO|nr:unnamed protein product [Bathycoccus prasinos]CCO20494.1 unnamed protein product [Bathycoccus prasinos]|eukprot:XP_007508390.1 unnamed protein product [Bathycoccus prasinos]